MNSINKTSLYFSPLKANSSPTFWEMSSKLRKCRRLCCAMALFLFVLFFLQRVQQASMLFNQSFYEWDSRSEDRGARSAWHNPSKSIPAEWLFTTPPDCLATSPRQAADVRLPAGKHSQVTSVCISSYAYVDSCAGFFLFFSSPIQNWCFPDIWKISNWISHL